MTGEEIEEARAAENNARYAMMRARADLVTAEQAEQTACIAHLRATEAKAKARETYEATAITVGRAVERWEVARREMAK